MALEERGVRVRFADIKVPECVLDLADLERQVNPRTRVVAITHASNAVGTIPDLKAVAQIAHRVGAWLWVDAVHYGPHGLIDVQAIDCDFLVCSSYKFYGPHLGLLYGKRDLLRRLRPYKVRPATEELPGRWETGTQNHECLAGLYGAFEYLADLGGSTAPERAAFERAAARIQAHEGALVARLIDGLLQLPGVKIYGITDAERLNQRAPTVSLRWDPHRPEDQDIAEFDRIVATNIRGTFVTLTAFGAGMLRRGRGSIVTIGSITALNSSPLVAYGPSKSAILAMTRDFAGAWGRKGIRVNCVCPGPTRTPAVEASYPGSPNGSEQCSRRHAATKAVRSSPRWMVPWRAWSAFAWYRP